MEKRCNRPVYLSIILFFILFFQFHHISAQNEIPDSLITERTRVIEKMLIQGKPNADRWWYGWLAGYSAATVGQVGIVILSDDKELRQDMAVGAASTLFGAVGQILTARLPSPEHLSRIPENTHEERVQKLKNAEEMLKTSAQREKAGRNWQTHAIAGVVNIGGGLVTWLGFKRSVWAGVENFAISQAVSEVQIWMQPTRAIKDYKKYCRKYIEGENPANPKLNPAWLLSAAPGMVSLKVVF